MNIEELKQELFDLLDKEGIAIIPEFSTKSKFINYLDITLLDIPNKMISNFRKPLHDITIVNVNSEIEKLLVDLRNNNYDLDNIEGIEIDPSKENRILRDLKDDIRPYRFKIRCAAVLLNNPDSFE